jgi:hypothetical protein
MAVVIEIRFRLSIAARTSNSTCVVKPASLNRFRTGPLPLAKSSEEFPRMQRVVPKSAKEGPLVPTL